MRQCLMQGPPASGGARWPGCTRVPVEGMVGAKVFPSSEGSRKLPRTGRQSRRELTHPAAPGLTTSSSPVTACHTVSPLGAPDLAVIRIRARRSPVGCTLQGPVTPFPRLQPHPNPSPHPSPDPRFTRQRRISLGGTLDSCQHFPIIPFEVCGFTVYKSAAHTLHTVICI